MNASAFSEMSSVRKWLVLFAICTFLGFLSFTGMYTEEQLNGGPTPAIEFLVNEATGAYGVFVLLPALFWFIGKYRFTKANWLLMVPVHLLGSMGFGAAHTLIMTGSRIVLYAAFDLRPYQMGDPIYRFLMEYQKQALAYTAILITIYLIGSYRENRLREKETAQLELRAAQLHSRLKESQLQALKGQLQPHFLFNTLNMISSLMYEDVEKADRMIARLSDLLRMSLEQTARETVPLSQELEFAEAYLEIMRSRFQDRLEFRQEVEGPLLQAQVPAFLLQPLIENAIKHGDQGAASPLRVTLSAHEVGGRLVLEVIDNGPGKSDGWGGEMEKGVGLSNIEERLERLYGDSHQFEAGNGPAGGFIVKLSIPFATAGEAAPLAVRKSS